MAIKSRLSPMLEEQMSESQTTVLREIIGCPRGKLHGPFLEWIQSSKLASHAQLMGVICSTNQARRWFESLMRIRFGSRTPFI